MISEVGASMMVGGNIRGETRVLTTATVLETGKGNFDSLNSFDSSPVGGSIDGNMLQDFARNKILQANPRQRFIGTFRHR